MDTWIVLANEGVNSHHQRGLYVLKSRGMRHSNERREFVFTNEGLDLFDGNGVSPGPSNEPVHGSQEGRDRHAVV